MESYYSNNVYFDTSYDILSEGKKSVDFSGVLGNEKSYSRKVIEFIKKSMYHKSLDDKYRNDFTRAAFVDGQNVDAIDLVSVYRIITGQIAKKRLEQVLSVNKLVEQINDQVGGCEKVLGNLVEYKQVGSGKTAYIIPAIVVKFLQGKVNKQIKLMIVTAPEHLIKQDISRIIMNFNIFTFDTEFKLLEYSKIRN